MKIKQRTRRKTCIFLLNDKIEMKISPETKSFLSTHRMILLKLCRIVRRIYDCHKAMFFVLYV